MTTAGNGAERGVPSTVGLRWQPMRKRFNVIIVGLVLLVDFTGRCVDAGAMSGGTPFQPDWKSLDKRPTPQWYLDAKFGIEFHWGLYSVPAWAPPHDSLPYAEWYWNKISNESPTNVWWQFHKMRYGGDFRYPDFAPQFRAELFDAERWADLFAKSGAQYVVPTSKHHDGFCLWPSLEASRDWGRPWNSMEIGPHRDVLGEMAKAVRQRGLKFGVYYSLYEWFNPIYLTNRAAYVTEHMIPQFKDLVTRYQPAVVYTDGEWDMDSADWKSPELVAWLFNESPCKDYVVINDRWGKETRHRHGGFFTTEYGAGLKDGLHPWEESDGMGYSYGYNRAENLEDYKSSRQLILMLCDLVSRGGNFFLDIGPRADGGIPVIMQERLLEMGDWLRVNGEAIYGTRCASRSCQWSEGERPRQNYGQFQVRYNLMEQIGQRPRDGQAVKQAFFTKKRDALYAIIPGWPTDPMIIRNVKVPRHAEIAMLGTAIPSKYTVRGRDLVLHPPHLEPGEEPCRYIYVYKIPGGELLSE